MKKPNLKSQFFAKLVVYLTSFQMMILPFHAHGIDFSNIDTSNLDTDSIRDQVSDAINNATPEEIEEARRRAEEEAAANGINADNAAERAEELANENGIDTSGIDTTGIDTNNLPSVDDVTNSIPQTTGNNSGPSVDEAEANQQQAEQQQQAANQAAAQAAANAAAAAAAQAAAEAAAAEAQAQAERAAAEASQIADAQERALAEAQAAADAERARIAAEQAQQAAANAAAAEAARIAAETARVAAAAAADQAEQAALDARIQERLAAERERETLGNTSSNPSSQTCPNGQTLNSLTGACLTTGENILVNAQESKCNELSGSEKDRCLGNLKELAGTAQDILESNAADRMPASTDAPEGEVSNASERQAQTGGVKPSACSQSPKAQRCKAAGHIFNCDMNFCATQEEQTELAAGFVGCKLKGSAEAEAKCISELEDKVADRVASGGVLCDSDDSAQAKSCRDKGHVWNCNHNQCLGPGMVDHLKDETKKCTKIENQSEKDACLGGIDDKAVAFIASGQNCDNAGNEKAKACEAKGNIWNCNVKYCLTKEENNMLTDEVVMCKSKPNTADQEICMSEIEDKAVDYMLFGCNLDNNPKGQACNAEGKQWNCKLDVCLSKDDNSRLINAYKNCNEKPSEAERKACFDEIKMLADAAQKEGGNVGDKLKEGEKTVKKAGKAGMAAGALVAAVGAVTGIVALASSSAGACFAMGMNIIAGGMAIVNESNNNKEAEKQMKKLREDYEKLEKKMGSQGISYELQVEAFQFYLQAANTAASIAKNKGKGYQTQVIMFGIAVAIAAVEAVVYAIPPTNTPGLICAGINGGAAAIGLTFSSKLLSAAKKAEKDYKALAKKVQNLLDLFQKHFKDKGGARATRISRDYNEVKTDNGERSNLERNALPGGEDNQGIENSDIGLSQDENACANKSGQLDAGCSCAKTNSCATASVNGLKGLGANGAKFAEKYNLADTFNDVNNINSGKINASDLDSSKLNKNATRFKKLAQKLIRTQLNPKLKKNGQPEIKTDNDALKAFIKKNVPKSRLAEIQNGFGKMDLSGLVPKGSELEKKMADEGIRAPSSTPRGVSPVLPSIDFDDANDILDEEDGLEVAEEDRKLDSEDLAVKEEVAYDYSEVKGGVVNNPKLSLFKVISNRYNLLRLEKRFGRR